MHRDLNMRECKTKTQKDQVKEATQTKQLQGHSEKIISGEGKGIIHEREDLERFVTDERKTQGRGTEHMGSRGSEKLLILFPASISTLERGGNLHCRRNVGILLLLLFFLFVYFSFLSNTSKGFVLYSSGLRDYLNGPRVLQWS
jgi:hypothetical protein